MQTLTLILTILALLSSIPVGYLIAWLCRDELIAGKKWFAAIIYACLLGIVLIILLNLEPAMILALLYLSIIAFISLLKSKDKKFTKKE